MSVRLNIAYDVLTDRKARLQYDAVHKKAGYSGSSLAAVEGLTGPLRERAIPIGAEQLRVSSPEAAVDWLQQWGSTIAFGCEVPFPTPLQVDPVPAGVRIAFISAAGGTIRTLGELYLEVDMDMGGMQGAGVAAVAVTRVAAAPERPVIGEREVLKALKSALRCKSGARKDVQVGGLWATVLSGALGALPLVNWGPADTAYDAYQIPKQCDIRAAPGKVDGTTDES